MTRSSNLFKLLHNRLCKVTARLAVGALCGLVVGASMMLGCSDEENPLAPYRGERALDLLAVTQSFTPAIQWVGGRVAAVGVNRGSRSALDSTLVWLRVADDNTISSHVTVGQETSDDLVRQFGGTPLDSLQDDTQYTFWLAEKDVYEANFDSSHINGLNFADTTFSTSLRLNGRTAGDGDFISDVTVTFDEGLLDQKYVVRWTPSDTPVRRIAIRQGAVGGFDDLIWHVVVPDSVEEGIRPPVVIGDAPPQAQVAIEWGEEFPEVSNYALWMNNSMWNGDFGFSEEGYAFFQIFGNNFE